MENVISSKTFLFSVRIVKLCRYLQETKGEYIMSKQLLRCGTSIGANTAESQHAQSRADFLSKLNIALKEAVETNYWLRLLHATGYLSDRQFSSIFPDCRELENILASIVKTTKNNSQFSTLNSQL